MCSSARWASGSLKPLAVHPRHMGLRPARALPVDPPVTQELLGDPVAGVLTGAPEILTAAHQITQPLLLR